MLGVVAAPAQGLTYWGCSRSRRIQHVSTAASDAAFTPLRRNARCALSAAARMPAPKLRRILQRLGPHVVTPMGSSLKFCLLAEGKAELYPRFGATSEWDTAAGQAVLEAAGGHVTRMDGHRLRYNCRESVINGDFVAFSHPSLPALGVPDRLAQFQRRIQQRRNIEYHLVFGHGEFGHAGCADERGRHMNLIATSRGWSRD